MTVIGDACGRMSLFYEIFNPITKAYRLKLLKDVDENEEVSIRVFNC